MKYSTGRAFRQALEQKLKEVSQTVGIPLVRLRKQIAFERFILRLQVNQPDTWILKGGLAMQLRLGVQSRTTKDVDLLNKEQSDGIYASLVDAVSADMGDWFSFEIGQRNKAPEDVFGGYRYHISCLLDGRLFEAFHVDIGVGDFLVDDFEYLRFDPILAFADLTSAEVPCYPITQQIAEKLHALTREYASGESTRLKDFVDILLLAGLGDIDETVLARAIRTTFEMRNTHPVPQELPTFSKNLRREYARLSKELDLTFGDFEETQEALAAFINPILTHTGPMRWDEQDWAWKTL